MPSPRRPFYQRPAMARLWTIIVRPLFFFNANGPSMASPIQFCFRRRRPVRVPRIRSRSEADDRLLSSGSGPA